MSETFLKSKEVYYTSGIIFLFKWWHVQSVYLRGWKAVIISEWKECSYFTRLGSHSLSCASSPRYSICSCKKDPAAAEGLCSPLVPALLQIQCLTRGTKQDSIVLLEHPPWKRALSKFSLAKSSLQVCNRGVVKCELRACDMQ